MVLLKVEPVIRNPVNYWNDYAVSGTVQETDVEEIVALLRITMRCENLWTD